MHEALIDFSMNEEQAVIWIKNADIPDSKKAEFLNKLIDPEFRKELAGYRRQTITGLRNDCGICCFSQKYDQPLMWSHYAKKHSGVCLGFNIHPVIHSPEIEFIVHPVNYVNSITAANYYEYGEGIVQYLLLTKSQIWAYEEEVRAVIIDRKGQTFFNFDQKCLTDVYYGCKTSTQDIEAVEKLLQEKGYITDKRQRMVIDESTFSIKPINLS
ncbi:DUF2971 domain-containing protein [Spirosoma endophyticum]|nr:DUF2971 domain-containing protein [Spirosoma endophyticum]